MAKDGDDCNGGREGDDEEGLEREGGRTRRRSSALKKASSASKNDAAHYLDIKSLLDLTCQTVADMIKGKTPEEIRKMFNFKNDFTPEEEEEFLRENQWAF